MILVLITSKKYGFYPYADTKKVAFEQVYKDNLFANIVKKFFSKLKIQNSEVYYKFFFPIIINPKIKNIDNYERVIITDSSIDDALLKYINTYKDSKRKCLLYYMNAIEHIGAAKVNKIEKYFNKDKIYTLVKSNAIDMNLNFVEPPYKKMEIDYKKNLCYEIIYLGLDLGRSNIIIPFYNFCKDKNIKVNFNVLTKKKQKKDKDIYIYRKMNYKSYLRLVNDSKCILEVVREYHNGFTNRTAESIVYGKKLITNNSTIIKYDFYNTNNILYFDSIEDLNNKIENFLDTPFIPYDKKVLEKFDIDKWIDNFK